MRTYLESRRLIGKRGFAPYIPPIEVLKAFPSAYGAGAYTTGGRGGIVVHVTNLNDSGTGSLREALLMTVPRTIVFDISGRIALITPIYLRLENSDFTVAGQTAPEGGITISEHFIAMSQGYEWPLEASPCNNIIWRYIRFRNGRWVGTPELFNQKSLSTSGTIDLMVDHCSFALCDSKPFSIEARNGDSKNITLQKAFFSQNTTQVMVGFEGTFERGDMSFLKNLYVNFSHRTPNLGGNFRADVINNVMIAFGNRLTNINNGSPQVNNIGNYYKPGIYTTGRTNVVQFLAGVNPTIYTANNYHPTLAPIPALNDHQFWTKFEDYNVPVDSSFFTTTMFPLVGAPMVIESATDVFDEVVYDSGANKYLNDDGTYGIYRDTFDAWQIYNIENNISTQPNIQPYTQPIIPENTRPAGFYGTNPHIPQVYLALKGLDDTLTIHNEIAPNGYTNFENYINQVDN